MPSNSEKYDVFISYRRHGGEELALLLEERLHRLGYHVFLDVESLRSGDFNIALLDAIANSIDFLLVLSENALDRCFDSPEDWVRQEIHHALKLEKNIIPLMKRNFVFPSNLPEDIADVANKNGIFAGMDDFNSVINRLTTKFLKSKPYSNDENEEERLKKLVAKGDSSAMNALALLYEYGALHIVPNSREALKLYHAAAENDYLPAIYNLGDIYEKCSTNFFLLEEYGIQFEIEGKDPYNLSLCLLEEARKWYQKAVDSDYAPAIYKMGDLYEKQKEYGAAFEAYKLAALKGYPPAQNAIGYFYQHGIGTHKNLNQAREWYKRAVSSNYPYAFYNYAILEKVTDPECALNLLSKVAFGDNAIPIAVYELAKLYETTFADIRNAIDCYQTALDSGVLAAQTDLERCKHLIPRLSEMQTV